MFFSYGSVQITCTLLYLAIKNMHRYVYLKYYITKVMYRNLLCKLALLALWYGKIQYHVTQACWVMNVTRHASQFISCTMMWNLGWAKFTEAPPTCTLAKNNKRCQSPSSPSVARMSSRTSSEICGYLENNKKIGIYNWNKPINWNM